MQTGYLPAVHSTQTCASSTSSVARTIRIRGTGGTCGKAESCLLTQVCTQATLEEDGQVVVNIGAIKCDLQTDGPIGVLNTDCC